MANLMAPRPFRRPEAVFRSPALIPARMLEGWVPRGHSGTYGTECAAALVAAHPSGGPTQTRNTLLRDRGHYYLGRAVGESRVASSHPPPVLSPANAVGAGNPPKLPRAPPISDHTS